MYIFGDKLIKALEGKNADTKTNVVNNPLYHLSDNQILCPNHYEIEKYLIEMKSRLYKYLLLENLYKSIRG